MAAAGDDMDTIVVVDRIDRIQAEDENGNRFSIPFSSTNPMYASRTESIAAMESILDRIDPPLAAAPASAAAPPISDAEEMSRGEELRVALSDAFPGGTVMDHRELLANFGSEVAVGLVKCYMKGFTCMHTHQEFWIVPNGDVEPSAANPRHRLHPRLRLHAASSPAAAGEAQRSHDAGPTTKRMKFTTAAAGEGDNAAVAEDGNAAGTSAATTATFEGTAEEVAMQLEELRRRLTAGGTDPPTTATTATSAAASSVPPTKATRAAAKMAFPGTDWMERELNVMLGVGEDSQDAPESLDSLELDLEEAISENPAPVAAASSAVPAAAASSAARVAGVYPMSEKRAWRILSATGVNLDAQLAAAADDPLDSSSFVYVRCSRGLHRAAYATNILRDILSYTDSLPAPAAADDSDVDTSDDSSDTLPRRNELAAADDEDDEMN